LFVSKRQIPRLLQFLILVGIVCIYLPFQNKTPKAFPCRASFYWEKIDTLKIRSLAM